MRKYFTYIFIALVALAACRREAGQSEGNGLPRIVIAGDIVSTKALLNSGDLDVNTTEVKVYDYITGFTGTMDGVTYTDATVKYIDDNVEYKVSDWDYKVDGTAYRWTRTGTHNFFGWLTHEKYSAPDGWIQDIIPGSTFNDATRIFTIPAARLNINSTQFDFAYSDLVTRTAESKNYSRVQLPLKHLFSAVAITVENKSTGPATINSITIPGLPNYCSATLDYSGTATEICTYGTPSADAANSANWFFTNQFSAGKLISERETANCKYNVYTGTVVSSGSTPDYRLLWPVPSSLLSPTNPVNPYAGDPTSRYKDSPNDPADSLIRLTYSYESTIGGTTTTVVRDDIGVKFPSSLKFEPGKLYSLNITLNDKVVGLDFIVQDWDFNEYSLEFTNDAATVPDPLKFTDGTYDHKVGDTYYTKGAQPISGKFRITNPVGAQIQVVPIGNTQYFHVEINPSVVDPTVNNGEINITVTPNTAYGTPTDSKTLKFSFYVVNGTRETNINSEVNYDDVTVVWAN